MSRRQRNAPVLKTEEFKWNTSLLIFWQVIQECGMNSEENPEKKRGKAQDVLLFQPHRLQSSFKLVAEHTVTKTLLKGEKQLVTTGSKSCSMRKDCIKWTFHYRKGSLNEGKTNKTTSHQALAKIPGDKRQKSSPQNSTDVVLTDWLHFLKCRRHTSKNVKKRNKSFKNEKGILSHTNGKSAHLRTAKE